jgi:uncharacterized protein (TIGR03435 family)
MKRPMFTVLMLGGLAAVAARTAVLAQQAPRTTWDGVYSAPQAERGATVYADKCAKCHGANGTGGDAPDLVGAGFAADWDNQPITGLFDRTRIYMPADAPQSLSREQTSDIIAFVLTLNEFPSGPGEFPGTAAALDTINYVSVKPATAATPAAPATFAAPATSVTPATPATPAAPGARAAARREFEVATIKPSAGQADRANVGVRISGSQVRIADLTLKDYIGLAYGIRSGQVTGPDWVGQERFDISAKFPDDVKTGDLALMLQTLLADRFQLVVHREAKDLPVYELAVAKSGLKLREAVPDANAVPVRPGTTNVAASGSAAGVDMDLGGGASFSLANNKLEIRKMTMASMADSLTRLVDRPVIDKTGLAGIYDLTLEFTPEDYTGLMVRGGLNAGVVLPPQALRALDVASANPFAIPLENYGLTLESRRAPVDLVVVDSMQKTPKDN